MTMFAVDVLNDSIDQFNAVRLDKPCGASYIPQNAKCSKGAGKKAKRPASKAGSIMGRAGQGAKIGSTVGASVLAGQGAVIGGAAGGPAGALGGALIGAAGGFLAGGAYGGAYGAGFGAGEKGAKALEKRIKRARKKTQSGSSSPKSNGGESVQAKGGYAKFLRKKGIDPSKLGANSKKAEGLAQTYNKTPAGRAEMAKQMMEYQKSKRNRR